MRYLWIAIGSAIGGAARYWCYGFMARYAGQTFPWGALLVNVVGCSFIGFFAELTAPEVAEASPHSRPSAWRR